MIVNSNHNLSQFGEFMSRKRCLQIVNFDEQLHYKDKNPIWIKLYCSLLDHYEFAQIADESKFHAVGLMILAARLNNRLPEDEAWLRRKINANAKINLKLLLEIGFLEPVKAAGKRAENSSIACKSNKTNADDSRAVSDEEKNRSSAEQNRTEENRTDEKRTQHNTTDETSAETGDAESDVVVVVCDFKDSSEDKAENQSGLSKQYSDDGGGNNNDAHLSEFGLHDCLRYVERCRLDGQSITNPKGLATTLYQTGKADAQRQRRRSRRRAHSAVPRGNARPLGNPARFRRVYRSQTARAKAEPRTARTPRRAAPRRFNRAGGRFVFRLQRTV